MVEGPRPSVTHYFKASRRRMNQLQQAFLLEGPLRPPGISHTPCCLHWSCPPAFAVRKSLASQILSCCLPPLLVRLRICTHPAPELHIPTSRAVQFAQ
eukprot:599020-Alexandrium_andersonii.AAC.1